MLKTLVVLTPYNPSLPLKMYCDASYNSVFGYALTLSLAGGKYSIIKCGLTVISETQRRYSVYELELTALSWSAIKCQYFMSACLLPTIFMTDHSALNDLEKISLDEISNNRVLSMLKNLMYNISQVM